MKTNILHDRLTAIAGRVRVLSLAATGLATLTNEDDLCSLADMADAIEAELLALANQVHPVNPDVGNPNAEGTVIPFGGGAA